MSNYVQSTNFATKDALISGNPLKIVKGTEINTEFANIAIAVATKGDTNANTTGTSGGLTGSPSITVADVTVGSATNALSSVGTNTTLGNNTVFVAPSVGFGPSVDNAYALGSPTYKWGSVQATTYYVGSGTANITASGNNIVFNSTVTVVPANGFGPSVDNAYVLGGPSLRWTTVYATTGTINTSDARQKQQGRLLSDAERAVAVKIKGLIKTFRYNEAVEKKGDAARIHVGVYAQELADAFASEGLNAADYGMFCYDELDSTGIYGVRYEELLAFVISTL